MPVAKATPVARPTAPEPVVAPPTFTHQATPPQPVAHAPHASAIDAEAGVNLNDMFDELKYELEEVDYPTDQELKNAEKILKKYVKNLIIRN